MKRNGVIFIILFSLILTSCGTSSGNKNMKFMDKIVSLKNQEKYKEAEKYILDMMEKDKISKSDKVYAYNQLSKFKLMDGQVEKAEEILKEGLRETDNNVILKESLTNLYLEEGRLKESEILLDELSEKNTSEIGNTYYSVDRKNIYEARMKIAYLEKNYEELNNIYEKYSNVYGFNIQYAAYLIEYYENLENLDKAKEIILSIRPNMDLSLEDYIYVMNFYGKHKEYDLIRDFNNQAFQNQSNQEKANWFNYWEKNLKSKEYTVDMLERIPAKGYKKTNNFILTVNDLDNPSEYNIYLQDSKNGNIISQLKKEGDYNNTYLLDTGNIMGKEDSVILVYGKDDKDLKMDWFLNVEENSLKVSDLDLDDEIDLVRDGDKVRIESMGKEYLLKDLDGSCIRKDWIYYKKSSDEVTYEISFYDGDYRIKSFIRNYEFNHRGYLDLVEAYIKD